MWRGGRWDGAMMPDPPLRHLPLLPSPCCSFMGLGIRGPTTYSYTCPQGLSVVGYNVSLAILRL